MGDNKRVNILLLWMSHGVDGGLILSLDILTAMTELQNHLARESRILQVEFLYHVLVHFIVDGAEY